MASFHKIHSNSYLPKPKLPARSFGVVFEKGSANDWDAFEEQDSMATTDAPTPEDDNDDDGESDSDPDEDLGEIVGSQRVVLHRLEILMKQQDTPTVRSTLPPTPTPAW
eukprot:gene15330-21414_t